LAIINGNYSFIDLNAIKGNIIDTLSVYYGEEYRETISSRLDRVLFVPFHSMPYINEYYNNYIYQFEDEIIDTTLTKLGLESTPELREILRTCSSIKDNRLSEVVYYNNSIADSINPARLDNLQKYQRMQVQKFIARKDAIMKRLQSSRMKYATKISPSSLVADQSLEK